MSMSIQEYTVLKELGKGKSGYSYLVEKNGSQFVLKKIHHEPVDNYHFGNKMEREILAYQRLQDSPISIPTLIEYNLEEEYLIKEYIDGEVLLDIIASEEIDVALYYKIVTAFFQLENEGINIDYFPANFIVKDEVIYYIDYEINTYSDPWNFMNWGIYLWFNSRGCKRYLEAHDETLLVDSNGCSKGMEFDPLLDDFQSLLLLLDLPSLLQELSSYIDPKESIIVPITSGFAGTSIQVQTTPQDLFIKLYPKDYSNDLFEQEVNALQHDRLYVPRLLYATANRANETKLVVLPYIENQLDYSLLRDASYCAQIIPNYTSILHALHQETCENTTREFVQEELKDAQKVSQNHPELTPFIELLSNQLDTLTYFPLCNIHRDYHPWNYLHTPHQDYMIDLKDGSGDFRFDVCWTYLLLRRSNYLELANQFIAQYTLLESKTVIDWTFFQLLASLMWYCSVVVTDVESSPFLQQQLLLAYEDMTRLSELIQQTD